MDRIRCYEILMLLRDTDLEVGLPRSVPCKAPTMTWHVCDPGTVSIVALLYLFASILVAAPYRKHG